MLNPDTNGLRRLLLLAGILLAASSSAVMAQTNYSNLTDSTNIYEYTAAVGELSGYVFGILILILVWLFVYVAYSERLGFLGSVRMATTLSFVLSLLLWYINFVSDYWPWVLGLLSAFLLFLSFVIRD